MAWFNRQSEILAAMTRGDLDSAIDLFQQRDKVIHQSPAEIVRIRQRLTNALIDRASSSISSENLNAAWRDLSVASEIATPSDQDLVSRHSTQLVELTIESAESMLFQGKTRHALNLLAQLNQRHVLDWRADRIREVAHCLQVAEKLGAEGRFEEAIKELETAYQLQPELDHLQAKIDCKKQRQAQLKQLTKDLQSAALSCHWKEVNEFCERILKVAPKHEIAIAAKKHSLQRIKRRTSAGSRITNVPERVTDSNSFFQIERDQDGTFVNSTDQTQGTKQPATPTRSGTPEETTAFDRSPSGDADSFLIWVDGVGGYLVCCKPVAIIGQALDDHSVSIPLQADIRHRHARLELIAGQHLVQPLGDVFVDEQEQGSAFVLSDGQVLGLGPGVRLKYRQPHPLSKTSRLDFVSRHRTQPWSDGVLLASQSIILGPNRNNHVYCPRWKSDVIFFQRGGEWFCRRRKPFQVDGEKFENEAKIRFDSHITGEDFSLTLEPV